MSRQWAQFADLSRLNHIELRVLPGCVPAHPNGFQILHGADGVMVEGPTGAYTPPGEPGEIMAAYRAQFADLWEASDPYPG